MKAFTAASVTLALAVAVSACGTDKSDSIGTSEPAPVIAAVDSVNDSTPTTDATTAAAPGEAAPPAPSTSIAASIVTNSTNVATPTSPTPPTPTTQPVELAAWQTLPITDVDGITFTLGEYLGQPLLIESFATWCSKCRSQLGDTNQAASELGDEAAFVALSVETDLSPDDVASYQADNDFQHLRFAIMSPELLAAMADAFGTSVANPPSTPKIIVDAGGQPGDLSTGPQSVDDLVTGLRAAEA